MIEKRISKVLVKTFPSYDGNFKIDLGPNDISEWDSMGHLNLIMALGEEFNITLDFEEVMAIQTVGDIITILERRDLY